MAIIGFSAFKTRKPRQFEYNPRYYDPEKEAREARRREILGDRELEATGKDGYKPGQYITEMRLRRGLIADRRSTAPKPQILRLVLVIALAGLILWFMMS